MVTSLFWVSYYQGTVSRAVAAVPNDKSQFRSLFKLALLPLCAILIFLALSTLYDFTNTLNRLDVVESERDQWQRPLDVLRALNLREGNTVVDLGSGAGYFALKLSPAVGKQGSGSCRGSSKAVTVFLVDEGTPAGPTQCSRHSRRRRQSALANRHCGRGADL